LCYHFVFVCWCRLYIFIVYHLPYIHICLTQRVLFEQKDELTTRLCAVALIDSMTDARQANTQLKDKLTRICKCWLASKLPLDSNIALRKGWFENAFAVVLLLMVLSFCFCCCCWLLVVVLLTFVQYFFCCCWLFGCLVLLFGVVVWCRLLLLLCFLVLCFGVSFLFLLLFSGLVV